MNTCRDLSSAKINSLIHRCICRECRDARNTADTIIAQGAEHLAKIAVPPEGAAETLALLRALAPNEAESINALSNPVRQRAGIFPLVGGAAALAAITALVLITLPLLPARKSLAAEVHAALSAVNTWHLSGWKLVDGRRVRWEVWGRRTPYFYREQIGSQIIWDDGRERYQIFGADAALGRPTGFVLKSSSRPNDYNPGWNWIRSFGSRGRNRTPWKETQKHIIFTNHDYGMQGPGPDTLTDNIFTIDKSTMLLTEVNIRQGKHGNPARTTTEHLQASYDMPLPSGIRQLHLPPGLKTVDTTGTGNRQAPPREKIVIQNGLSVQATPVAVDKQGFVLIRVRAWLGDTPLNRDGKPFVWGVSAVRSKGVPAVDPPACYDEKGRTYLSVNNELLELAESDQGKLMLLVPLEPHPDVEAPPQSLRVVLRVSPQMVIRLSSKEISTKNLMTEEVNVNISLPPPGAAINVEAYKPEGWERRARYPQPLSTDSDIALARANFYRDHYSFEGRIESKKKTSRSYWKAVQAARWGEEAVALAPVHSSMAQFLRLNLANNYHWLGETAREEALLQKVISESVRFPAIDPYYRRMAERKLQTLLSKRISSGRQQAP